MEIGILIAGPGGTGKTTFISHWAEHGPYKQPERPKQPVNNSAITTEVAKIKIGDDLTLLLYSVDSQNIAHPAAQMLADWCVGLIVLADSTQSRTFPEVDKLLETYDQFVPERALIVANKQDTCNALLPEQVRSRLKQGDIINVEPCVATREESCKEALLRLLYMIIAWQEAGDIRGDVT